MLARRTLLGRHDECAALDGLIVTEPTSTNVNDVRAILILETARHDA